MSLRISSGIGIQIITATLLPKTGDREDFSIRVQGPDPITDFSVPLSITGTALAIWGNPSSINTAENLGRAIFKVAGTASLPPKDGFWFDSYNSGDTVQDTINRIANIGTQPFVKNWTGPGLYIKSLGVVINEKIKSLDIIFSQRFDKPFFKSLEDIAELSQRVDDLNTPARSNAEYLYKICLLSLIIDHINIRSDLEDTHLCSTCANKHHLHKGSLQGFKQWLIDKLDPQKAVELTVTFQMIKNLRKQYPIHEHYIIAKDIRTVRKEINEANIYFGTNDNDFGRNAATVINKFSLALDKIIQHFQ